MPGWKIRIDAYAPATDMTSTLRRSVAVDQALGILADAGLLEIERRDTFVARHQTETSAPSVTTGTTADLRPVAPPPAEATQAPAQAEGTQVAASADDLLTIPENMRRSRPPIADTATLAEIGRQVAEGAKQGEAA